MIYAIQAAGTEFVKFGFTKRIAHRLVAHQVSCPLELVILATAEWSNAAETRIHNLLRQQCVRGEWFKHTGMSIRIVDLMLSGAEEAALYALRHYQSESTRKRLGLIINKSLIT